MKRKNGPVLLVVAALALVLAGCTTFQFSGAEVPFHLPSYRTVGKFKVDVGITKFLGTSGGATLFNVGANATSGPIYDAIQREIQSYSADAAINISIDYKASFVNMLLNGITSGLYAPATAVVSGTLIKYTK